MQNNYEFFTSSDLSKFKGEWVAIDNKKVIYHGKNITEVYKEAKKILNGKRPFISKVREATARLL
ncbi:hypothetical protein HYT56_00195 [Candidatus Woesearchaeota archaeon]|nr:hypothetical protein [Candidatus Woesearchaeota archaeon]